ncbi:uncharacterized protein LOC127508489 isoform X3 [Ctenopharyngodon idella]|uniref:uncharacterized protein LOC127508489 isoform X3 n=1 Tax=Ctenopharyngodon idella TaxID=7959 RepID=UPI0022308700|nr:uncharacterized protein LOC127508489 isoform X3 [Ctenopharyngodon idella]
MACAQQCAAEYLRNCRRNLVTQMRNLPLIIENLYQQKVFNDHEVDALKAERTEFDKARSILDWVINKGETACYELLRILDATQKRTLDSDLHYWICCFPFRVEDTEISYSTGTKPCQNYQKKLKNKAKNILKDQREHCGKYLGDEGQVNFHFISLVLETDSEGKTPQCKIKWKNKKCKKLRPKKLRAYIPNEEQALSPVDLLRCQDKNILLIGKPGIGKTTVVQEIMRLWAEKDDREFYYMFYFDESVLAHSSRVVNLESIFFDVYLKPKEKDRKDVFQDIEENSENVVIVFDGVVDLEENSTLRKIMKHELLPDAKIIITCRSEVEYDPLFSSWPTRKVYVQGFSEKSISTYYQSMLGHDSVLLDDVLKNQELFSLSHVPMYAFMIVDLIQFKNDNVYNHLHTVTEMYIHIFRVAVKKHGKKKIEEIDMYLKEIKDQIHLLMKNAFSATMQKCLNLPDISSVKKDICHAFLKMITTRDSPTSATTYCAFLHNTMQEFFSALWLLGNPGETEKVLHLCQTEENKHMRHVLPFLCGLLGEHNINLIKCLFPEDQIKKTSDWFIEKFLDTFLQPQSESEVVDLLYVCQCLYELQSPKACLMFLEKMDHQLEPEGDLDPHQCCALSYVIGQSRDKEVYLNLEDCNMTDTGMKMMLRCSPKIRLKIWEDPLKQITFFLEFFHKVSQCSCSFFDLRPRNKPELCDALLDLCSHVKNYETQTGWSFLPVLQSVFQSPDVWIIDLSQRKTSVLLEVLKLQTEKKPVELRGCSEEESEMKSFLQCLPYISQLSFCYTDDEEMKMSAVKFLLNFSVAAVETDTVTGTRFSTLLSSVCSYETFPLNEEWGDDDYQSDFLLDLCSHVKNYETQTGWSFLPVLQSVFQSPDVWIIDLSQRKTSVLLEVLKLQTEKKPVKLRRCSEEESEMKSFLQCLPHISQLRFWFFDDEEIKIAVKFLLNLSVAAVENDTVTGTRFSTLLSSVCSYKTFPFDLEWDDYQSNFLLDLYSHMKNYETQTGRSFLPALQSVFQSPGVWTIDLSERKTSVLLEVLKLQTEKKPVKLRGCSEEESKMMSVLQYLPYISQLRFSNLSKSVQNRFLLRLFIKAAETETQTGQQMMKMLTSVCVYRSFPYGETDRIKQSDFLLDLYSHVKNYETQTGRSFLPALQSVFQLPKVWIIDLSERKTSVLLEVLKLQTEKKPVELRRCSEEESEMMSFLQCLPYISQLRIDYQNRGQAEQFVLKLFIKAGETETQTGEQMLKLLTSVYTYRSFPYEETDRIKQSDLLLDLYSHVKNYETQTGSSFLPALQSVFQSPDVWIIDLSQRKTSVLLEVLKLQTEKKPVELRRCSEEESEMMSFLQCLPYISQLRFSSLRKSVQMQFLLKLFIKAAETETQTGEQMMKLLTSVCTYRSFPYGETDGIKQRDFLLGLYSHVNNYKTQTGRSFLPALQSVFQSPDVWIIDLSQRKTSVLLEVLKLQTEKKPVDLRGCSEEESEIMSFLQCLPYISQLRFSSRSESVHMDFVLKLFIKAAETETQTGEQMLKLLTSVCTYSSFPYGWTDRIKQRDFLLDLCSHVKNYETQTGGSFLPALQSVFQSPDVWIIDLSQRKTSVLLEVLKLQTEKKPVELRGCSEEESEMMSFLQCLPYISQLRIHYKNRGQAEQFLLKLFNKAAETETQTGEQMLKLLTSVCTYSSFPYEKTDRNKQRDFLLDLCSHVKKYETQTALQSVFQSPDVWIIDLSKRKTSVLLKALKLQTVKKPVELRGCLEEEREMMSLLHCLPYISQLRFSISVQNRFILKVFIKAAAFEKQTGKQMLKLLASVCTYSSFPYERTYRIKQRDLLLDLYSHVKNYETQTGRSFLPALQSVFQLPDVWIIDLSQRKTSVLLEVLKLQTEKKPVKLRGCSEEESEMSFLQCLPYISQLRIDNRNIRLAEQFVLKLFIKAAETEIQTGEQMLKLLTSVCTYSSFPYERTYRIKQSDFLLDLYSHVKNYETQTGRSFLPALQSVFQLPDDWIIDLSQRKTSVLLEVLKLQTEKKPVELRGCSEEESEVRSFLQCLPYISQLRFTNVSESVQKRFHLKLLIKAAETETQTGEQMLKLLTSVCAYRSFPYQWTDRIKQRDFLLDLCSHVKNYETQTGGSFLPALQSVFQSPKVWIIDLSQRKTSVLLEVLKLQTEKKPVELRGCSEEESEMKSFLQCLPHISQLSCSERCLLTLVKVVQLRENPDLVTLLLEVLDFSFSLEGSLSSKICRSVGRVLRSSADRLNLTLKPEAISIRGTRLLFRHITHIHTLRLSGYMVVRIVQALRSMRVQTPVTVNELTLDPNDNQLSERKWSRVLSSLAILLRLWTVQCLNLTEYKMESVSLSVLLCHQGPLILRSSKESLQKLVECVCEAQEEELTQHFLQKVGGDLTSCSLSWEELHYFLQHKIQQITVDFRKSNIQCKIREILPFLNRIQFKRLSSSFMLSIMREIYESGSAGFVSSLLSSVKNYISLQSRELDSVHCAALRFTLQHCTAVSLNLLWTSIPEEELESIVPLFRHVSSLSVDRRLLLKMLHCCSVSDVQQEAAAVLLSVLQHKLDFCRSALDLTTNTDSEPLHLTTEDCRVMSTVIQRAHTHTQLIMQDCVINTAGMDQLFPVLRSVKLCCDKSLLLQFLAHVRPEEAVSLSRALGDEVDLSQTHLEPQVCRGLVLILEYSEGLTELDLSQCRLTDHSLDLLLPNLHKAQNIDFSGNSITDIGAQRIYSIVSDNSNIKTVRLFNNRIEFRQLFLTDPRFEIW